MQHAAGAYARQAIASFERRTTRTPCACSGGGLSFRGSCLLGRTLPMFSVLRRNLCEWHSSMIASVVLREDDSRCLGRDNVW